MHPSIHPSKIRLHPSSHPLTHLPIHPLIYLSSQPAMELQMSQPWIPFGLYALHPSRQRTNISVRGSHCLKSFSVPSEAKWRSACQRQTQALPLDPRGNTQSRGGEGGTPEEGATRTEAPGRYLPDTATGGIQEQVLSSTSEHQSQILFLPFTIGLKASSFLTLPSKALVPLAVRW